MKSRWFRWCSVVAIACFMPLAACSGSDSDNDGPNDNGGAGAGGEGGAGGSGGALVDSGTDDDEDAATDADSGHDPDAQADADPGDPDAANDADPGDPDAEADAEPGDADAASDADPGTDADAPDASGDGGSGGAGGSDAGGDGCGIEVAPAICNACMDARCCEAKSACGDNPSCLPLLMCINACDGEDACVQDCVNAHPGGIDALNAVIICANASCEVACGRAAPLGAACEEDIDCGQDTFCMKPTDSALWGGGPARGYCTADCTAFVKNPSLPSPCVPLGGICSVFDDVTKESYCNQLCEVGEDIDKCHNRGDSICFTLDPNEAVGEGWCRPYCQSDADCGSGRACDFSMGVCMAPGSQKTGAPVGTSCTAHEQCAGFCYELVGGESMCSAPCAYYNATSCNPDGAIGGINPASACLLGWEQTQFGDYGVCTPLCDEDADCNQAAGLHCDSSWKPFLGHGACQL